MECRPPNYYELLGLPALEPDVERIRAAALDRTAIVRRYQLSDKADEVQRLLAELSHAFDCLTDPARKVAYDHELRGPATVADAPLAATHADVPLRPLPVGPKPVTVPTVRALPRRRKKANPAVVGAAIALLASVALAWLGIQETKTPALTPPPVRPRKTADVQLSVEPLPAKEGSAPPTREINPSAINPPSTARPAIEYGRQRFVGELNALGLDVQYLSAVAGATSVADSHLYRVARAVVQTIEYGTTPTAADACLQIQQALQVSRSPANSRALEVLSPALGSSVGLFRRDRLVVVCGGGDSALHEKLAKCVGEPLVKATARPLATPALFDTESGLLGRFVATEKQMGRPGSEIRTGILNQRTGTLAAWIRPERSPPVRYIESVIDADLPLQAGSGWGLCAGMIKVILDDAFWDTGVPVRFQEWQHVALTFHDREAQVFVDGRLAATHAYRQGPVSRQHYVIGKSAANALYFQGSVQDARIYDRVIMPQAIAALASQRPAAP